MNHDSRRLGIPSRFRLFGTRSKGELDQHFDFLVVERSGVAVVTGRTCPDFNRMEADMTTLSGTKLTDTQLIALSGAAQRQDGAVSLPERIKGMAAQKLATSLMDKGIVREIRAKPVDEPLTAASASA